MDAYYLSEKIKKYWAALHPINSGQIVQEKKGVKVFVETEYGLRQVTGIQIKDSYGIVLSLDNE